MLDQKRSALAHLARRNPMIRLALFEHRVPGPTEHGAPLSFSKFPFMAEPYSVLPWCEEMVAMKCTQVGWTEMTMIFMVMTSGLMGRKTAYIMPHDGLVKDFVQEKFTPMLDLVPYYRALGQAPWRETPVQNVRMRQFGVGSIRFLGSRIQAALRSFTADSIIIDEVDECDQRNLPLAKDRIRSSSYPQMIRLGNPSIPGRGISRMFDLSDGREWHHRCPRCNERQPIDWFQNVIQRGDSGAWEARDRERARVLIATRNTSPAPAQDIRPVCRRCERPWTRTADGCQWVAARPGERRRGYHVSQMDVVDRSLWGLMLEYLEAQSDPELMRAFYAGVLGAAYERSGARVTYEDLRAATAPRANDYEGAPELAGKVVTCGVDVGSVLNVTVSLLEPRESHGERDGGRDTPGTADELVEGTERDQRPAIWVGAVRSFAELRDVIKRYHVDVCVIDHNPERTAVEEFRDWAHLHTSCVVWACSFYLPDKSTAEKWGAVPDPKTSCVRVGRTELLDAAFSDIRDLTRTFPEDVFDVLGFKEQMQAPGRMLSESGDRYIWWSGSGKPRKGVLKKPDHYRFADAYDKLAAHLVALRGGYFEFDLSDGDGGGFMEFDL